MLLRRGGKKGEGDMSYQLIMPKQIFYGEGALEQAAPVIAGCGSKALIVTDPVMVKDRKSVV